VVEARQVTDSLLESEEHEKARYELFKTCERLSTHNAAMEGYAVAFVLFDVVHQLAEINKNLTSLRLVVSSLDLPK
jgi:hypothetical protein